MKHIFKLIIFADVTNFQARKNHGNHLWLPFCLTDEESLVHRGKETCVGEAPIVVGRLS
jgi:hypothetical protein